MFKGIDLSSDTATLPCDGMKQFMLKAELGDEQRFEDPTTLRLEHIAAELLGFECAVFLPSATMANIISICTLSKPGELLLAAENAHLLRAESGGAAIHANVMTQPLNTLSGIFTVEQMHPFLNKSRHSKYPSASVVSIENTTNLGGGRVWPHDTIKDVLKLAREFNVKSHLDGSRLFNASVKLNLEPKDLTENFDMVTVCLSKGLSCPIGSLLVYNTEHDKRVQQLKKLMGGSMRQSGMLAAAGIYALENNIQKLKNDHENASIFFHGITGMPDKLLPIFGEPETNMVYFTLNESSLSPQSFLEKCCQLGVRFSETKNGIFRAVFHNGVNTQDVGKTLQIVSDILY